MSLNTGYLQQNRGIIKILQIICGFVVCSLLCSYWTGGRSCFYNGQMGYSSGLNFVILVINCVLLVLNILNVAVYRLERVYSLVGSILFAVAFGMMIWTMMENGWQPSQYIPAVVIIGIEMVLFIWDYQILHGQSSNW